MRRISRPALVALVGAVIGLGLLVVGCGTSSTPTLPALVTTPVAPSPTAGVATSPAGSAGEENTPALPQAFASPASTESPAGPTETAGGDPAAGKKLFAQKCEVCHTNGGRTAGLGPSLVGGSPDAARIAITKGRGSMRAYSDLIDSQVEDLVAYLQTLY